MMRSCGAVLFVAASVALLCSAATTTFEPLNCLPDYLSREDNNNTWPVDFEQTLCSERGCTWLLVTGLKPSCTYPENWGYYKFSGDISAAGATLKKSSGTKVRWSSNSAYYYWKEGKYVYSMADVTVKATRQSSSQLQLKFTDATDATKRYEISDSTVLELAGIVDDSATAALWAVTLGGEANKPFQLKVTRAGASSTDPALLDTTGLPGFSFDTQFIEISFKLPTEFIYGFGEHEHQNLKHDWVYHTLPMFARAHGVGGADGNNIYPNLYGTHPFFMGMDAQGKAFGVLFWNSNAMEVVLQPNNILTYRTIGGLLDMRIFLGPTPTDVIQQYHKNIGTPYFPPYWSLGFQLSKYWYQNLTNVENLHARMTKARIPWDVQHHDIDYMDRQRAFTIETTTDAAYKYTGIRKFVADTLQKNGMRSVMILDPAMTSEESDDTYPTWDNGIAKDIWVKFHADFQPTGNEKYLLGKVWPDKPSATFARCHTTTITWDEQLEDCRAFSAFPDWFKPESSAWWVNEAQMFYKGVSGGAAASYGEGIPFDGIWIDMNEPENFIQGSKNFYNETHNCPDAKTTDNTVRNFYDLPPYIPHLANRNDGINIKTTCMTAVGRPTTSTELLFYDVKTLYGHAMAVPTLKAANEASGTGTNSRRSMVFSRSTFAGTGALIGHWLGDNISTWESMRRSVIGMLEMNIFGIAYTGADICGFFHSPLTVDGASPAGLCYRWTQVGAFYTFSRNHATKHKPDQDPASYGDSFAAAARRALSARYTLLPYLYTIMYEANKNGGTVLRTFMEEFYTDKKAWVIDAQFMWGSALMISPVLEDNDGTIAYVPAGRWYDYYTGVEVNGTSQMQLFASDRLNFSGDIPLHIRGGHIIPAQEPGVTTTASRLNPMWLFAALNSEHKAAGNLHWDDGETVTTAATYTSLDLTFTASDAHDGGSVGVKKVKKAGSYDPKLTWDKFLVFGLNTTVSKVWFVDSAGKETRDLKFKHNISERWLEVLLSDMAVAPQVVAEFTLKWASPAPRATVSILTSLLVAVATFVAQ